MGARGPKPDGQQKPVALVPGQYPKPMVGMLAPEKTVWNRIVRAFPEGHFRPQHYDLLRAFCEASVEATRLKKKIRKEGDTVAGFGGVKKANPLFPVVNAARSFMASASTKLGITNNSATKSKGDKPEKKSKREGLMFENNG
jgi:P27 family predicted phage terminase small subunit